mmetsp:Transcript_38452/g.82046  ORF Transcript_38452/g.82046 Transcript_38452/m.82046 type:complete len:90 (-) Transcript_38452:204-473(-)
MIVAVVGEDHHRCGPHQTLALPRLLLFHQRGEDLLAMAHGVEDCYPEGLKFLKLMRKEQPCWNERQKDGGSSRPNRKETQGYEIRCNVM